MFRAPPEAKYDHKTHSDSEFMSVCLGTCLIRAEFDKKEGLILRLDKMSTSFPLQIRQQIHFGVNICEFNRIGYKQGQMHQVTDFRTTPSRHSLYLWFWSWCTYDIKTILHMIMTMWRGAGMAISPSVFPSFWDNIRCRFCCPWVRDAERLIVSESSNNRVLSKIENSISRFLGDTFSYWKPGEKQLWRTKRGAPS